MQGAEDCGLQDHGERGGAPAVSDGAGEARLEEAAEHELLAERGGSPDDREKPVEIFADVPLTPENKIAAFGVTFRAGKRNWVTPRYMAVMPT
jgi:hypothetical protein